MNKLLVYCSLLFTFFAAYTTRSAAESELHSGIMIIIPAGSFQMGSSEGDVDEQPVHQVTIRSFKMGQTEVTFSQWDRCVEAGACTYKPDDEGWGRGDRPVTNLSRTIITQQYIPWLNTISGLNFRLPTEAEWEYAARAGSKTKYSWGDRISCGKAQYAGGERSNCFYKPSASYRGTAPVAVFRPNAFGLYDMHGNVWEWTHDCWKAGYDGAPIDGSAWTQENCLQGVLRGGSSYDEADVLRVSYRLWDSISAQSYGFRLVLDI